MVRGGAVHDDAAAPQIRPRLAIAASQVIEARAPGPRNAPHGFLVRPFMLDRRDEGGELAETYGTPR
ncbi:hypothetical protein D3C73_1622090 [compost metagenome]